MVVWGPTRSWRVHGWIRGLVVALPVLLLPVAVWPSALGATPDAQRQPIRIAFLCALYLVFAALAWVAFRLRVDVTRGTVRVTNAGRSTVFAADDVVAVEPTARGVRFVIHGRDPVIAYAVACPPPAPGERPRWLDVAEVVAGEDPARATIVRRRVRATGVRSAAAQSRTTAYRFTGSGLAGEREVCQCALDLMRSRLRHASVTFGRTDDWPVDLGMEVAALLPPRGSRPHRGPGRDDGHLDLVLDLGDDASFDLLLRLLPWVTAVEARRLDGSPSAAVFDRCRDAQLLLTSAECGDLRAAAVAAGLDPDILGSDGPRGSDVPDAGPAVGQHEVGTKETRDRDGCDTDQEAPLSTQFQRPEDTDDRPAVGSHPTGPTTLGFASEVVVPPRRHIVDRFDNAAGLFLLRLTVAAVMAVHGLQMVQDRGATEQQLRALRIPSPDTTALILGPLEIAIAVALVLGIAVRVAGLGTAVIAISALVLVRWTSTDAIFVAHRAGFVGETELLLAGIGLLLLGVGGGGWGLDHKVRNRRKA